MSNLKLTQVVSFQLFQLKLYEDLFNKNVTVVNKKLVVFDRRV